MPQTRLTERSLRAIKLPATGQVDHYDTDRASPHGFGVRVSHTGTKTFFVKYVEPDGFGGSRQKRVMLKTNAGVFARYPDVSLADARELGFVLRRKVASGEIAKGSGKRLPFGTMVSHYVENHAKPKKRSWKEDARILNKYFADWHRRPADDITHADVVERIHTIKRDNGPIMANRCLAAVRIAYKFTMQNPPKEDGHAFVPITFNPAREVTAPGEEREADRTFTETEISALWGSFGQIGTAGLVYKLALVTGQRIGEVQGLRDSEIDADMWGLPGARTKNGRFHIVPLTPLARNIIAEAQKLRLIDTDLVFASIRRRDVPVTMGSKVAGNVRALSDVEDFSAHHLRRTAATGITRLGFSRFIADRVLNHVEGGVGRVYDRHGYDKEKRAALDAWGTRLKEIISSGQETGNVVPQAHLEISQSNTRTQANRHG